MCSVKCQCEVGSVESAGSSTMIHLEISARRMSSNRVCIATPFAILESWRLLLPHQLLSKHLSLPHPSPTWNLFTAAQRTCYYFRTLCHTGNLLLPRETPVTATTYCARNLLLPRYSVSVPHHFYTIARARTHYCHKIAQPKPYHSHTMPIPSRGLTRGLTLGTVRL